MILSELKINGFRSFCEEEIITFEPDVTVLTGANDVGKTAALHLVRMLCLVEASAEGDLNFDTRRRDNKSLVDSNKYRIEAVFHSSGAQGYINPRIRRRSELSLTYYPNRQAIELNSVDTKDDRRWIPDQNIRLEKLPRAIDLTLNDFIRSTISLSDMNPSEDSLLAQAFGPRYKDQLSEYSEEIFHSQIRGGVQNLNKRLQKVLPDSLSLGFAIEVNRHEGLNFVVGVVDELTGDTPIRLRGTGSQRLLRLLTSLLDVDASNEHVIILLDEPENSLHADAQHALRYLLEMLANEPFMQVIYATHSPSMINPTRPRSLRLLSREFSSVGNPTTRVNNEPYEGGNFQLVRSSLGITPADSLLYAAITVLVEGDTEVLGLSKLFEKLINQQELEPNNLEILFGQIHIVGVGGYNQVHKWVRMSQSQGSQPIVLVDGDKIREVKRQADSEFPLVPVLHFKEGKEFEDIVPPWVYFAALAEFYEPKERASEDNFNKWWADAGLAEQMMFSKRVEKWVRSEFNYGLDKPKVMSKAIERAKFTDLDLTVILELIRTIQRFAEKL